MEQDVTTESDESEFRIDPASTFGYRLWHVHHAWQRRLEAALGKVDLTHMQFVVLAWTMRLITAGSVPSQTGIADAAGVDRMMVSKILRLLEGKGYVQRCCHPDDPRANRVDLTRSGHAALARALPILRATQEEFFGRLGAAGKKDLSVQLDRLLAFEGIGF
jgi:DNA-binding MarR family transcriptional regulator